MRAVAKPISEPGLENYYLEHFPIGWSRPFAIMPALVAGIDVFLAWLQREGLVLRGIGST
jgi:hypothetical protein